MTRSIIISTFSMIATAVLCFHPMQNQTVNVILYVASLVLYGVMMGVAYGKEEKLKSRIQALEDKLNDKEQVK